MSNKYEVLVIMLSNTADEYYRNMTNVALNTMFANKGSDEIEIKCVLVETNSNSPIYEQENVYTLYPNEPFSYNRFLNMGYELGGKYFWPEFFAENNQDNKFVSIANNDLVYGVGWAREMIKAIKEFNLDSVSPKSKGWQFHHNYVEESINCGVYEGWGIGFEYCGWKQLYQKSSFDKLYPLDEDYSFWCADNSLTMTMQKLKMRHALVASSHVQHLTSRSHGLIPNGKHHEWTQGQVDILHKKISEGKYD